MKFTSEVSPSPKAHAKRSTSTGLSLIEVLLSLALLSITVLPITLLLSQTSQNSKGVYLQSSRSLLLNHLMDTTSPDRATYYTSFNDAAKDTTTINESGQNIPFMRKVDTSNTNTLQKRIYFYLYNSSSDPDNSPRYSTALTQSTDEFRMRCGSTTGIVDSSGFYWYGDTAYSSANKEPGYDTGTYTTGNSASDIVNSNTTSATTNNDDQIFQYYREGSGGTDINYSLPLPSGNYTVKLYFSELDGTVTDTSPNRRRMDIYMEGANTTNGTYYSPWLAAGSASNKGSIYSYDVSVTDGTLNVVIKKDTNSDKNARLSGIVVQKRGLI